MTEIDQARLERFVGQAVGDMGAAISGLLVHLGDQLGLYRAMAGAGPVTAEALASQTGTAPRYVREWLSNQAAGGYVTYRPQDGTFELPAEHAAVLADENSPVFLGGAYEGIASCYSDYQWFLGAFPQGETGAGSLLRQFGGTRCATGGIATGECDASGHGHRVQGSRGDPGPSPVDVLGSQISVPLSGRDVASRQPGQRPVRCDVRKKGRLGHSRGRFGRFRAEPPRGAKVLIGQRDHRRRVEEIRTAPPLAEIFGGREHRRYGGARLRYPAETQLRERAAML